MGFDEACWVYSAGLTPEWRGISRRRAAKALGGLRAAAKAFESRAPASARARGYGRGLRFFLDCRHPLRDRLAAEPAFDYWLYLWEKHFSLPCEERDWHLQFGLFGGFAAELAAGAGARGVFPAVLDPDAHLHFYGGGRRLEFPKALALAPVTLTARGKALSARGPKGERGRWVGPSAVRPGLFVEDCGFLLVGGVVMHGLCRQTASQRRAFLPPLRTALAHIEERDPALHAEMTDLVRILVPLVNTMKFGSVSSSYVNLRGAICLSHAADPLLQAETLIHEFCHQKMNLLLLEEPILLPGQSGQVFYSPWRKDARRLRGLILGAHAFLNVAAYLIKSLSRERYERRAQIALMTNAARRLHEVDAALRTICSYARLTDFGRRFVLGMSRELGGLFHAAQWFPPGLMREVREASEAHRARHALPGTGLHRAEGFDPKLSAARFKDDAAPTLDDKP